MKPHPPQYVPPSGITAKGLTVAITSFKRGPHLRRAIASAFVAGVPKVVVASMEPTAEVMAVAQEFKDVPGFSFSPVGADLGCNELWMQAAYRSADSRVLLLHDDDYLDQDFGRVYTEQISPCMDKGGFATWRAEARWDDGRAYATEYHSGETRILAPEDFQRRLLARGSFSLSPIVTVFDRNTLLGALKECHAKLTHPEHLLHPGMLLGTEIVAHFRNAQHHRQWLYINKILSYYGAHEESGTIKALADKRESVLLRGYDRTRSYLEGNSRESRTPGDPKILLVYSEYPAASEGARHRNLCAKKSWDFHFNGGEFIEFPVLDSSLSRSSAAVGEPRSVPFVMDLFNYGMQRARPEDIVAVVNRDTGLTTAALERIKWGVEGGRGAVSCFRHQMDRINPDRLYRTVVGCPQDGGADLFACTPVWWKANAHKLPDFLLGHECWDTCYRMVAEEAGGVSSLNDAIYHERHETYWEKTRHSSPGQLHNRELFARFCRTRPRNQAAQYFLSSFAKTNQ